MSSSSSSRKAASTSTTASLSTSFSISSSDICTSSSNKQIPATITTATPTTSSDGGKSNKYSKSEILREALGVYLKQKNYAISDTFPNAMLKLTENKNEFIIRKMMERDLSRRNIFTFSNVLSIRNNAHIIDQQFARFCHIVESQVEPFHSQLKRFYAPLLCHLYLELMRSQNSKAAIDFLYKYSHIIGKMQGNANSNSTPPSTTMNNSNETQNGGTITIKPISFIREQIESGYNAQLEYIMSLIETMSNCSTWEELEVLEDVQKFCSTKFVIETTQTVADLVRTFFERRGHVITLNILNKWIHVHIVDNEIRQWTEECLFFGEGDEEESLAVPSTSRTTSPSLHTIKPNPVTKIKKDEIDGVDSSYNYQYMNGIGDIYEQKEIKNEFNKNDSREEMDSNLRLCLDTLRETKEDLLKSQPEFPRFIKLMERGRGLTSADMDKNECHLVAGFNNSIVQLWQMNEQKFSGKNLYHTTMTKECCWNMNNYCRDEEDDIERDIRLDLRQGPDFYENKYYQKKYEDNSYNEHGGIELRGHGLGVTDVRFSKHFPLLYSTSKDSTMRCWRAENYKCAGIYRGHRYPIWCMNESPVRNFMATGSKDLTARLWCLEREFPFITYIGHTQDVESVAFHPNGNYLATGSTDVSVRMWDVTSGKLLRVFTDCKQPVCTVAFSPDGSKLAAGGEENKVRIFDIAAGAQLCEITDHTGCVTDLLWSTNSNILATSCRDGTCRLFDVSRLTSISKNSLNSTNDAVSQFAVPSTAPSSAPTMLMTMSSNCHRLVKVFYNRHKRFTFIGGID